MFDSLFDDSKPLSSPLPRFPSLRSLQISQVQANLDNAADPSAQLSQEGLRSDYSYQRILRKTQKRRDKCIEMLRSIGLFVSLSKLFSYVSAFLLTMTKHDPLQTFLESNPEEMASMHSIPPAIHLLLKVILLEAMFQCACGIYGYVRFNKGFLFFYGLTMIFMMVSQGYGMLIFNVRSTTDLFREKLFVGFRDHGTGAKAVYILQNISRCCGSAFYKYEGVTELPDSCCPSVSEEEKCVPEKKYNHTCRTTRYGILAWMNKEGMGNNIVLMGVGLFTLHTLEAILAFAMVRYLDKRKRNKSKRKEFERRKSSMY